MRIYLHTFGCKANQYETEVVRQALEAAGVVVVADPAQADWAVVNSCTVTHVSEAKMRALVRRLARLSGGVRTLVVGCAAALDDGAIARLPGVVDVIAGADPRTVLPALGLPADPAVSLRSFDRGARAWLKIQNGCDEHCTFCATTLARGASRSRSPEEIVREARSLAEGSAEIVLTGIHIGTYGRDLNDEITLGSLVEQLVTEIGGTRFRLSSLEATEIDERLAGIMIDAPAHLAPHVHAPLQSGSDRVLKRMGRHWYTAAMYRERVEWLASQLPRFGLGADVMVGFPGETEADHRATVRLVERLPYTSLHVFPYSERPGAASRRLSGAVPSEVTAARSAELRALAVAKGKAYRRTRAGGRADVVLVRRVQGRFEGLTGDYLPVYLPTDRVVPSRFSATLSVAHDDTVWAQPDVEQAA